MLQNYNFGIDIDKTLSNESVFAIHNYHSNQEDVEKSILRCTLRQGIKAIQNKDFNIILITGRPEKYRSVTIKWLCLNDINFDKLVMVPNDYYPNDFDEELYYKFKLDSCIKNHIHFALDDCIEVVELLRKYGINAQLVTDNFETAFNKLFQENL